MEIRKGRMVPLLAARDFGRKPKAPGRKAQPGAPGARVVDDFIFGHRVRSPGVVAAEEETRAAPPVLRLLWITHAALTRWANVCRASGAPRGAKRSLLTI